MNFIGNRLSMVHFFREKLFLKNLWFYSMLSTFRFYFTLPDRNHAERIARQFNNLKIEVEELKAEQLSVTSKLMQLTQQSEIEKTYSGKAARVWSYLIAPPFKISVPCQ